MAARLRRELAQDVAMVHGSYGEFKVLVNDRVVVDAGPKAILGILPSGRRVVDAVRNGLSTT